MDVAATRSGGGVTAVVEYDYAAKEADELDLIKGAIIHSIKQMPGGWWEGTLQTSGKTGMFPDNFVRIVDATASAASDDNTVILREKSATTNRRCKVIFSYTQVNDDELSLGVGDVIEFLGEVEEGWWRGRLKNKIGVFPSNFVTAIEPSPILASKRPAPATATAASTATTSTAATGKHTTSAAAAAAAAAASTKKMNRLSLHSSKEDLLSSNQLHTTITTSASSSSSAAAAAPALDEVAPSLPPKPQREYCRVEFPYAPQNDDELELKVGDIITIISMELPDKGWWKGELRGKVGVFPDNFVKLLAPSDVSPLNDTQLSQQQAPRTAKTGGATTAAASTAASNLSAPASGAAVSGATSATTSKVFIKKSGSTSSGSSHRKDSFGSRDSLNDILSETGLPSGNVAAQRKSLENKNLDLSNAPDASTRLGMKKQQPPTLQETKTILSSSNSTHHTTTTTTTSTGSSAYSELRKSLDNMDEKVKTPPPVLTKKPTVPSKKTTTVTSVAGNIFSGIKQKVKNVENKLTTAASHDYADGVGSSRMSPGGLPDAAPGGSVVMRRAATIAVEDSDFDRVERASMLPDMRAGRVKAPKRRPPSAAINAIGESNNNDSTYLNGSNGSAELHVHSDGDGKPQSSDDNSTGEEQLAKPKPREWEKKKAPWMEELKASQVKKKTSPNVEPRTLGAGSSSTTNVAERTSKLLSEDVKIGGSSSNAYTAHSTTSVSNSSNATSSSVTTVTTTKVQSSAMTSSLMQQSLLTESSQQLLRKEHNSVSTVGDAMTKSMSNKYAAETTSSMSSTSASEELRAPRPNSLSIRNRSTSPSLVASAGSSSNSNNVVAASSVSASSSAAKTAAPPPSVVVNNHHQENNVAATSKTNSSTAEAVRVVELERRVGKLEAVVHAQQRTIDELVRTLREETDRVKVLRGELDKYAQCVTQV